MRGSEVEECSRLRFLLKVVIIRVLSLSLALSLTHTHTHTSLNRRGRY